MLVIELDAREDEEARMELETYQDKWGLGNVPKLSDECTDVVRTYFTFHNQRTMDFPMAFKFKMDNVEIEVDGPHWVDFYERGWDKIHETITSIREAKRKRESGKP